MATPTPENINAYAALLDHAILNLRMRIRYGEKVSLDEIHDWLDALHNIPEMLRNHGKWHVEENIDWYLAQYDERWIGQPGSELRDSLVETLRRARDGEFDWSPRTQS